MRKYYFISTLLLFNSLTFGQFYESGQDPSSIRWKQIITKHARIIYPQYYEQNAIRIANILEKASEPVSTSLSLLPRRVPVVIHTQSVESNGFVVLAPRRMELYALPPQDIYSQDWLDQLGLHEYRHVVQMDKLNHGWTRFLSIFGGQQVTGAVAGLTPRWFLEGDAVHSETSYSLSGRGRLPSFEMELRTISLNKGKIYNYDKMLNGSYKDYVPDYYQYGYKLVEYGRLKYGNDLWEKVLNYTGSHPFRVVPFTLGLMKYSGRNKAQLQKDAFTYYDSLWKAQDGNITLTKYERINKARSARYADYKYGQQLNDSSWIALKTGIDQLPEIIILDRTGNEKVLLKTGPIDMVRLSLVNNILVWAEIRTDPRWDNRSYSIIRKLDINSGRAITLTHKTRYYAPSISPDGKKIAVASVTIAGQSSVTLLNSETGETLANCPGPSADAQIIEPCWTDNTTIMVIVLEQQTKTIQQLNTETSKYSLLFNAGNHDISDLSAAKGLIFFRASYSGVDNIFSYSTAQSKVYQVTSSRFGAYYPSLSARGGNLTYSDYSDKGFNLVSMSADTSGWIPIERTINVFNPTYNKVSSIENARNWQLNQIDTNYVSKPYRKVFNLFNFHSWLPFYYDYSQINLNNPTIYPGVSLISQNLLGTALSSIGYWNAAGINYMQADFTYKGWYPVLDFRVVYGGLPPINRNGANYLPARTNDFIQTSLQAYIPLLYTINSHYFQFYPSIYIVHDNEFLYSVNDSVYTRGKTLLALELLAYQFTRLAQKDLAPRFGQILSIKYLAVPWNTEWYGSLFNISTTLFFPGILNHHSLQLQGSFEKQMLKEYYLNNQTILPTGFLDLSAAEQVTFSSVSYSLPLLYPDLRLGPFFYLKRLRTRAFYDYAEIKNARFYSVSGKVNTTVKSAGLEIIGDFHLLRFLYPFQGGVRIYNLDVGSTSNVSYQLIFKLNLGGL